MVEYEPVVSQRVVFFCLVMLPQISGRRSSQSNVPAHGKTIYILISSILSPLVCGACGAMNSLQYISTQVDSLIGNIPEEPAELPQEKVQSETPSPELSETDQAQQQQDKQQQSEWDPQPAPAADEVAESILVTCLLFLPRTFKTVVYFSLYVLSFGFYFRKPFSTKQPDPASTNDLRHLQSPYGKDLRIPKIQTHFTTKIAFPSRPLMPKHVPTKTLVLDLDETLIHSLSRSSSFSQGQMVEIKLDANQLATLYLVNKRPFCDYFLRAVSQWYKLVIFTASVQAYADPMIDWLERERKYFHRRLYRQHCTSTPSGYVKDLSKVETDLSKVIIIDNSPISYSMHEHNAISVEGWISDPSDHSLLHLVPLLQALRYTTDVRSLLSLKSGESAFDSEN